MMKNISKVNIAIVGAVALAAFIPASLAFGYGGTSSGGGNGPIVGSFGGLGSGAVLGASTTTVPSTTVTPISCTALLTTYMRIGKNNNAAQVMRLQQFLATNGFYSGPITGYFGPLTEAAVKKFQLAYAAETLTPWGITQPTGYVYKTTLYEINALSCPSLNAPFPTL